MTVLVKFFPKSSTNWQEFLINSFVSAKNFQTNGMKNILVFPIF